MKIRNVIANMYLKGDETNKDISELHQGFGCPRCFGFHEGTCGGECKPCFDKENKGLFNAKNAEPLYVENYVKQRLKKRGMGI